MAKNQTPIFEIQFDLRPSRPQRTATPLTAPQSKPEKISRVAQVLALGISFQHMLRTGEISTYADLARLGCLSRERISQIIRLCWLAPDIQMEILVADRTSIVGRLSEAQLRRIAQPVSWAEQRNLWAQFTRPAES